MAMVPIQYSNAARRYESIKAPFEKSAQEIYSTGRFLDGRYADRLCRALLDRKGYTYCVLTSSGTAALYLMGLFYRQQFDTILTTPYTFRATHNAFAHAGYAIQHTPVDHTTRLGNWNDNPQGRMLNVLVGIFGAQPTQYNKNHLSIMDGCQNWIGSKSKMSMAISFDPTKIVASNGNGGAILTNDASLFSFGEQMVRHGQWGVPGLNLRMTELECAYVLPQLELLDEWMDKRRKIAEHYVNHFGDLIIGHRLIDDPSHDWQKVALKVFDPQRFYNRCRENNVEVKRLYQEPWPVSEDPCTAVGLPIYPEMTYEERSLAYVAIRDAYC